MNKKLMLIINLISAVWFAARPWLYPTFTRGDYVALCMIVAVMCLCCAVEDAAEVYNARRR